MVFVSQLVKKLSHEIPDDITLDQFLLDEHYGRSPYVDTKGPALIEAVSGKGISLTQQNTRVDHLAAALYHELQIRPGQVVAVFSPNTLDVPTVIWGTHRIGGVITGANPGYTVPELVYQLKAANAIVVFTISIMLATVEAATKELGWSNDRIFLLDEADSRDYRSVETLVALGKKHKIPTRTVMRKGDGKKTLAFISFSSGTTGLPKGVMISHFNVIANVIQDLEHNGGMKKEKEVVLGLLPWFHIYGLVVILSTHFYRGNTLVAIPKFELQTFLDYVTKYRITSLFLVPPIVVRLIKDPLTKQYDLTHVRKVMSGAAPMGPDTMAEVRKQFPKLTMVQGYGMTETATVVSVGHESDLDDSTVGPILPGWRARLVDPEGRDIETLDTPGELYVSGPSVTMGYLNNPKATAETFIDGWVRTGDEGMFVLSAGGIEHLRITDRLKELIKVKAG